MIGYLQATKLNDKFNSYEANSTMLEKEKLELSERVDSLNSSLVDLKKENKNLVQELE